MIQRKPYRFLYLVLFVVIIFVGSCFKKTPSSNSNSGLSKKDQPALDGRLVFHRYSCYTCLDAEIWIYDFKNTTLTNLSAHWNITNPMNAHGAPDARKIVFMGIDPISGSWDIYLFDLNSGKMPLNLTHSYGMMRDEDPKFSHDGTQIVFKQNGILKIMDTLGNIRQSFTVPQSEASMPYFSKDDQQVIYAGKDVGASHLGIYSIQLTTGKITTLFKDPNIEAYYPIVKDATSFYYTRWVSGTDMHDQLYLGRCDGTLQQKLLFNTKDQDYSDAFPVRNDLLFCSVTALQGQGQYDLFLADGSTGDLWTMDKYNSYINTSKNELGAFYWP